MTRKIKALGVAFFAALALTAVSASVAQAGTLDIGASPAVLTGANETSPSAQSTILTLTSTAGGKFNTISKSSTLEATTQGLQTHEVTATAAYTETTAFGVNAQVDMNGCKFTLTGASPNPANTATVDVVGCTPGKQISITTAICTLHIPEQNGLSHVVGSEPNPTTTPHSVTLAATVKNITVTQTGAACPDGNEHHSNNAEFNGNTIVKAFGHAAGAVVTKHGHQYTENKHTNVAVSLTST